MQYAAIVLDLGLPDEDGLTLLRDMRRRGDSTPVLVLTARDGVSDRVTGLREGADDYLAKPFAMEELVARLQALLRRPGNLLGQLLTFGNVALDTEGRQVFVDGAARAFPARETAVLEILLRRGGNVAPKRLFEDHLFGLSGDVGSNAVEVYVHRLRKMLGDAGATREDPYGARRRLPDGGGKGRVIRFRSIITPHRGLPRRGDRRDLDADAAGALLSAERGGQQPAPRRAAQPGLHHRELPAAAARRQRHARHSDRGAAALFRRLRALRLCRARFRRAACCSPRATTARRCSRSTSRRVRDWYDPPAQHRRGAVRRQRGAPDRRAHVLRSRSARTSRIATSSSTTSSRSFFPRVAWITFPILLLLLLIDILIFRRALELGARGVDRPRRRSGRSAPTCACPSRRCRRRSRRWFTPSTRRSTVSRRASAPSATSPPTWRTSCARRSPSCARGSIRWSPGRCATQLRTDLVNMTRTVNQVLDIAELESFLVATDAARRPARGLRRSRRLHGAARGRRGQTIALTGAPGPVWVRGHAEALFRAVRNLVENAIRHTPAGVLDRGRGDRRTASCACSTTGRACPRPTAN